jgi:hypothetical protein
VGLKENVGVLYIYGIYMVFRGYYLNLDYLIIFRIITIIMKMFFVILLILEKFLTYV